MADMVAAAESATEVETQEVDKAAEGLEVDKAAEGMQGGATAHAAAVEMAANATMGGSAARDAERAETAIAEMMSANQSNLSFGLPWKRATFRLSDSF